MGNQIKDLSSVLLVPYLLNLDASFNKIADLSCFTAENKLEYL